MDYNYFYYTIVSYNLQMYLAEKFVLNYFTETSSYVIGINCENMKKQTNLNVLNTLTL